MMQPLPRILVVGGSGFIGQHVVSHAVALGWSVTSLSLSSAGKFAPGVQVIVADIADRSVLRAALNGCSFEYVVNCGGYVDHALFCNGGRRVLDAHFLGVMNLVETLDRDTLTVFVNIGSSDEYGSAPAPQVESQRELPISPYSFGKVAATHFLQMLYRSEGFPATTLRLFLTYGPGQNNHRFLPQIVRGCLEGREFPSSEGRQLRDFCFIQDVVDAVFAALSSSRAKGEILNIASGRPVSIRRVIEMVQCLAGRGEPQFGKIAYRPGENMALYASIAKAKDVLDWEPVVSLEVGLQRTIDWIVEQG
jgi:nucleoside-diphosphate-sugar epimerase